MTTMADISREGIVLAGGGRALLLQIANPAVGAGVARHSDFAGNPMGRLHGTLRYVYAVTSDREADAVAMRRSVNKAHVPVRGDGYNAMDPALQLWVAATLYQTAISVYEDVYGPVPEREAEAAYREYAVLGTALQMPPELWPATRADFAAYWSTSLEALAATDEVRAVQRQLFRSVPWIVRRLVVHASTAMLPESVRAVFALDWDDRRQRRWDRTWRLVKWSYRRCPVGIRSLPQRVYLRQVRSS